MGDLVKLQIYEHTTDEIIIDSFEAKSWEDFIIIEADNLDENVVEALRHAIQNYSDKHPEKQILLIPKSIKLTFYGIEKEEEDGVPSPASHDSA